MYDAGRLDESCPLYMRATSGGLAAAEINLTIK
jgi:hypothetical protein